MNKVQFLREEILENMVGGLGSPGSSGTAPNASQTGIDNGTGNALDHVNPDNNGIGLGVSGISKS